MSPSTTKKRRAAEAALAYVEDDMTLGIGTGSTVAQLIEVLKDRKIQLSGAVSCTVGDILRMTDHGMHIRVQAHLQQRDRVDLARRRVFRCSP